MSTHTHQNQTHMVPRAARMVPRGRGWGGAGAGLGEEGEGMGKYRWIATEQTRGCAVQRREQSQHDGNNWTVPGGYRNIEGTRCKVCDWLTTVRYPENQYKLSNGKHSLGKRKRAQWRDGALSTGWDQLTVNADVGGTVGLFLDPERRSAFQRGLPPLRRLRWAGIRGERAEVSLFSLDVTSEHLVS